MKAPLLAMTILGLSLITYGVLSLLRNNQEVRAQVMMHLSPDYQIKLTNLLNKKFDLGSRFSSIEALDPATCTTPTVKPEDCKTSHPESHNHTTENQSTSSVKSSPMAAEIKRIQEQNNERNKVLNQLAE